MKVGSAFAYYLKKKLKTQKDRPEGRSFKLCDWKLSASVQLLIESGLLSGSSILVQNTLGSSLVDLLNSNLDSLCLVSCVRLDSSVSLLDLGLELRIDHLVLQSLSSSNLYALLSGLDVGHSGHLLENRIIVRRNRLNRIGGHRFA